MQAATTVPELERRLVDRRRQLETVIAGSRDAALPGLADLGGLDNLLHEVDDALARIAQGTFGTCEVCHGSVEADRLAANPLARTCLDCLTVGQQRALERDLDLAGHVQRTLLPPRSLRVNDWETAYEYQPLGPASGDYIDLMPLDSGEMVFLIGDVSGKGVAASLLMTYLHATIRSLTRLGLAFDEVLYRTNRLFHEGVGGDHYATLLCGKARDGGELELFNAGHCPAILLRGTEAVILPATSVPIGLFADVPFPMARLRLDSGDSLIVYTDGVTEASDGTDREYGRERLVAGALERRQSDVRALVSGCLADLTAFRGSYDDRHDDLTLFALRRW